MRVFKGYMLLWLRNWKMSLMYFGIFLGIVFLIQYVTGETADSGYQAQRENIAVILEEDSVLAEGLLDYLDGLHEIVDTGTEEGDIQSALYYRQVTFVVTVPEGFETAFLEGNGKLDIVAVPGSVQSVYLENQLQTWLKGVRAYTDSGYTAEEAVEHMAVLEAEKEEADITMSERNGNAGEMPAFYYFMQFFPYLSIPVLGYTASHVLMQFRRKDIHGRLGCAPVSELFQNLGALGMFCVAGAFLLVMTLLAMLLFYGSTFIHTQNQGYYLTNMACMTGTAMALAFLFGVLIQKEDVLNAVINTVALGFGFLGGVFVPLEILGDSVRNVSRFLPVYWYEVVLQTLGSFSRLTPEMKETIFQGYGIQAAFMVACTAVALAIVRIKRDL